MLFLWLQWIILFAVFFDKNYSCVVGMEPGKKRRAERAFSNLFKFYNQIAIIWQSHKLSTFSSHPPWGPNILNSRIKKGTETFTTNPLNAANRRKKGERQGGTEPGRTEENRGGFSSPWGRPSAHFWFLSPALHQGQHWGKFYKTAAWALSPRRSHLWVKLRHQCAFKPPTWF